jgi:hypothetical protein
MLHLRRHYCSCCNLTVLLLTAGTQWLGGRDVRRGVVWAVAAMILSGCVSDQVGTDYASVVQKIGPPKAGLSRIVVLQEKRNGLSMAICACDMKLDGEPIGKVIVGRYAYADVPAGRHQLVAAEVLFPGETARDFATESGRTYYFLIKSSERHDAVTGGVVLGGLVRLAAASVVTSGSPNTGPAELYPLDEPTARITLAELQFAQ